MATGQITINNAHVFQGGGKHALTLEVRQPLSAPDDAPGQVWIDVYLPGEPWPYPVTVNGIDLVEAVMAALNLDRYARNGA
ncbi:MAG: hypothetical protein KKA73_09015 [Chloroflexi bacterium]|nr:hypothetical protein [Chloroflexota bacterium]